jgi:uncharacterized protein (TIGR03382 family)
MQLRALFAASFLVSTAVAAQTPCDPETFEGSCTGSSLEFCDTRTDANNPVTATFDCAAEAAGASCGAIGCTGAASTSCVNGELFEDCQANIGGACIGAGPLLDDDAANDEAAFALLCVGDGTCLSGSNGDSCVAHLGGACSPTTEPSCVGNTLVFCRRFIDEAGQTEATFALNSNIGLDCTVFGATCGADGDGGFNCIGGEGEGEGEGGEGEGEGEGEDDDGGSRRDDNAEPAPAGLCSGFGTNGAMASFAVLGLALALARRRRRA